MERLREEQQKRPDLNESTRRALSYAQMQADQFKVHIGTLQLYGGILREMGNDLAVFILEQNKIDIDQFNTDSRTSLRSGKVRQLSEQAGLTDPAKNVLSLTVAHARLLGASEIQPQHMLVAIARYARETAERERKTSQQAQIKQTPSGRPDPRIFLLTNKELYMKISKPILSEKIISLV